MGGSYRRAWRTAQGRGGRNYFRARLFTIGRPGSGPGLTPAAAQNRALSRKGDPRHGHDIRPAHARLRAAAFPARRARAALARSAPHDARAGVGPRRSPGTARGRGAAIGRGAASGRSRDAAAQRLGDRDRRPRRGPLPAVAATHAHAAAGAVGEGDARRRRRGHGRSHSSARARRARSGSPLRVDWPTSSPPRAWWSSRAWRAASTRPRTAGPSTRRGRTVAVLGSGLDRLYPPENAALAAEVAGETGLLVSEFPLGTPPSKPNFPRRNRVIAGWARAVVVVEAGSRSGALSTARAALDEGRDVMAVPGHPTAPQAEGTNRLLQDGAALVRGAADVLARARPGPPARPRGGPRRRRPARDGPRRAQGRRRDPAALGARAAAAPGAPVRARAREAPSLRLPGALYVRARSGAGYTRPG